MPGRPQALMRTRCPECGTVFRVTSEQLRLKAGKVRCGQCQAIFNAFDGLQPEVVALPEIEPAVEVERTPLPVIPEIAPPPVVEIPEPPPAPPVPSEPVVVPLEPLWLAEEPREIEISEPYIVEAELEAVREPVALVAADPVPEPFIETMPAAVAEPSLETPEESTLAAREAGLVAARELSDTPAYDRWAAGTLASNGLGGFDGESSRRAVWPFVLVAILLLLALAGQLALYFRTEIVQRLPDAGSLFAAVGVEVPLPKNVDLIAIESSDLQSDNARGLFVLQATLHNRARFAQAWPVLELTLTDTSDTVVSRRVMKAGEYLPPNIGTDAFPANGEVAVRLWIEARDIGAAGYRLYVFYP